MWTRYFEVEDRISTLEASTVEGVAVKLHLLWCWQTEDATEHRYGAQPDSDDRTKIFWGIFQNVKDLSKGA